MLKFARSDGSGRRGVPPSRSHSSMDRSLNVSFEDDHVDLKPLVIHDMDDDQGVYEMDRTSHLNFNIHVPTRNMSTYTASQVQQQQQHMSHSSTLPANLNSYRARREATYQQESSKRISLGSFNREYRVPRDESELQFTSLPRANSNVRFGGTNLPPRHSHSMNMINNAYADDFSDEIHPVHQPERLLNGSDIVSTGPVHPRMQPTLNNVKKANTGSYLVTMNLNNLNDSNKRSAVQRRQSMHDFRSTEKKTSVYNTSSSSISQSKARSLPRQRRKSDNQAISIVDIKEEEPPRTSYRSTAQMAFSLKPVISEDREHHEKLHKTVIHLKNKRKPPRPTSIPIRIHLAPRRREDERLVNGFDEADHFGVDEHIERSTTRTVHAEQHSSRRPPSPSTTSRHHEQTTKTKTTLTEIDIARLIADAPPDSVKQRVNVEREEEEIIGPLPLNHADGSSSGPDGLLNFDTISEQVDLGIVDGKAQMAVKVRCERIVPIRGTDEIYKKSSVIVTRLMEIDLEATEERKILLDNILRGVTKPMLDDRSAHDRASGYRRQRTNESRLNTKDTFKLYKTFMGIAEADEGRKREQIRVEKRLEDEDRLPEQAEFEFRTEGISEDDAFGDEIQVEYDPEEMERQLEDQLMHYSSSGDDARLEELPGGRGHIIRHSEPDNISYLSHASEQSDIMY